MKHLLTGSNIWAILGIFGALCLIGVFLWRENNIIGLTQQEFVSRDLPEGFDGYRILHISDLHNKSFGTGQEKLLKICADVSPDLIVITGDLIDKRRTRLGDIDPALNLANGAARIAPTFFVCGNHEITAGYYDRFRLELMECGVAVLDDETVELHRGDDVITLAGIQNVNVFSDVRKEGKAAEESFRVRLRELSSQVKTPFSILLSHRPDLFEWYLDAGFSLTFCGHAHGGQVRIPGLGGVLAPNQGFFGKYTAGLHIKSGRGMNISRGLGNSGFPIRLFNRPEVVLVTLRREK
ncbi:metallophosphoesterase [Fumia xinanensis]|uniref:Metallophosphoesterase n=1 Tax=Fumia xinanensis TaxID=2763659 RepID=A0A926I6M2_9FIRM|nr:metallophosphoesterase [Fumia xinanensis]MBC8560040.1 metallophosphoesterase [Fumia xinanensis]